MVERYGGTEGEGTSQVSDEKPVCRWCGQPIKRWGPLEQWGHAELTPFTGPMRFWDKDSEGKDQRVEPRDTSER